MNRKTTCALAIAAATLPALLHADYNSEGRASFSNTEIAGENFDTYAAGVTFYTEQLSYRGQSPYDEAAFFNQVGQIDLTYGRTDTPAKDFNTYAMGYTHRSAHSPHGFNAGWTRSNPDSRVNIFGLGYFQYLDDGFTVGADVSVADRRRADDHWTYRLSTKRLLALHGERWLSLDSGLSWNDYGSYNRFGADVTAAYFFTARTSLGVTLGVEDRLKDFETAVTLSHYFQDNFALDLSYGRDYLDGDSDPKRFEIGGRFRF